MRTAQEVGKYLTEKWNKYNRFSDDPKEMVSGDAMFLWGRGIYGSDLVSALEKNRDIVKTRVNIWPDKEFIKEAVNFYNQIIDYVKGK